MQDILGTIGFDWRVAIANLVSFLIIFFILKKWVFGPLGKTIAERKAKINEGLTRLDKSEKTLADAKEQAEKEIQEARQEANKIIAQAKQSGDDLVTQAGEDAQVKAEEIMTQAKKNIAKREEQMEHDLLSKTADLVGLGVSKILDEDLDAKKNKDINQRIIKAFKKV